MSILIAGGNAVSRHALVLLLQTRLAIDTVGEAQDELELMRLTEHTRPQIVLLDGYPADDTMTDLIDALHQLDFRPDVIVLSGRREVEEAALRAGADAFVWKAESPKVLLTTVERFRLRRGHE